jgi:hypothetical protein
LMLMGGNVCGGIMERLDRLEQRCLGSTSRGGPGQPADVVSFSQHLSNGPAVVPPVESGSAAEMDSGATEPRRGDDVGDGAGGGSPCCSTSGLVEVQSTLCCIQTYLSTIAAGLKEFQCEMGTRLGTLQLGCEGESAHGCSHDDGSHGGAESCGEQCKDGL